MPALALAWSRAAKGKAERMTAEMTLAKREWRRELKYSGN
jgi:hypothetical protein